MKPQFLSVLILLATLCGAKAEKSEIEAFLETRPSFKKMDPKEIEVAIRMFFADSAYLSERNGVEITVIVRKGIILGYEVIVTGPIVAADKEAVMKSIAAAYEGYTEKMTHSGRNSAGLTLIDEKKLALATQEEFDALTKQLAP